MKRSTRVLLMVVALLHALQVCAQSLTPEAWMQIVRRGSQAEVRDALRAGADPTPALRLAIELKRDVPILRDLVDAGAEVTPSVLASAVRTCDYHLCGSFVAELLELPLDAHVPNWAFMIAILHGVNSPTVMEALMRHPGTDVNSVVTVIWERRPSPALIRAKLSEDPGRVRAWDSSFADTRMWAGEVEPDGVSYFQLAVQTITNPQVIELFYVYGVDPDWFYFPVMPLAAAYAPVEVVQTLLDNNDVPEQVALLAAVESNTIDVVRLLLRDWRARWTDESVAAAALRAAPAFFEAFLESGGDVNYRLADGRTPLMIAAGGNPNPEVINMMLAAGADVAVRDARNQPAAEYARNNKFLYDGDYRHPVYDILWEARFRQASSSAGNVLPSAEVRPAVHEVRPNPIVAVDRRQPLEVWGSGFVPGSVVALFWGDREFVIPPDRATFVSAGRIDVIAGVFPADVTWRLVVRNPNGAHSPEFPLVTAAP